MTCASIKSLMLIKDVTAEDAFLVRKVWSIVGSTALQRELSRYSVNGKAGRFNAVLSANYRSSLELKRAAINVILGTHGVEYLGQRKGNREEVHYCNAGDAYATTVMFDGEHLRVGCWGDLVERELIRESQCY